MRRGYLLLILAVAAVLLVPMQSADADGGRLLIDYGDGRTEWTDAVSGDTFGDVLTSSVEGCSLGPLSIGGVSERVSSGDVTVVCSWHVFSWNGEDWVPEGTDPGKAYAGGDLAFGFYPDGITPAANPDSPTVWTQMGGDSASTAVSGSKGPDDAKLPVEWYTTHIGSYVDSCLVSADDMIYHTTAGVYDALDESGDPWLHCLDRFTGETIWTYHTSRGAGYEVTTPLIVGDFIVVSFTNGDLTVLDRFTGDVKDSVNFPFEPPYDGDGSIAWDGRTFITGATTPVYDSGVIYFGLSDGRVMAYTLSPEGKLSRVWCHTPETGIRGCFYFHAPVIADVDGKRCLFIGSYEGYLHCLDASDGTPVWEKRLLNMMEDGHKKKTPGSVSTVSVSPDGSRLLVTCTDGEMIPYYGFAVFLDSRTGEPLEDVGRLEVLMNKPVVTADGFMAFVMEVSSGGSGFHRADGTPVEVHNGVYRFDWDGNVVWDSAYYNNFKGQLTLADGIVYGMDYSAGLAAKYPGGCVTAIDADDGSEVFRLLLRPCTDTSYAMTSVLVVDGRLYTANDMGAVYCISDVAGAGTEEEWVETLQTVGFKHWSWAALLVVTVSAILVAYRLY